MILLVDNYDSFTHNLYQYLRELTEEEVRVIRNDRVSVEEVRRMAPSRIVISPGPGRPEEAGISVPLVKAFAGEVPILGVCLGHQAIGYAFGAQVIGARRIVHGKAELLRHDGRGVFRLIENPAAFTRYHSLVVDPDTIPQELEISAWGDDGELMGLRHREYPVEGIQFHPESIASDQGKQVLKNFLRYRRDPFELRTALDSLIEGNHLSQERAEELMEELTEGNLSSAQIAAFLTAIRAKGATPEEIAGCAAVLQRKAVRIYPEGPTLDTCGTGGDGSGTFNISSLAALVAAACGVRVAKHGNRAVSSRVGSAGFYRSLGIDIELPPERSEELLNRNGFAFLFAPLFHGSMKHAAVPRREMGVRTIMNLVGPLANPAGAEYRLIGVYDASLCRPMAEAARLVGVRRGMVVHSRDGLDELSPAAVNDVVRFTEEEGLVEGTLDPADYGITGYSTDELVGGAPEINAREAQMLLAGTGRPALREAVALNAGAALWVYGSVGTIDEGIERAREALDSGIAQRKLEDTVAMSNRLRGTEEAAS